MTPVPRLAAGLVATPDAAGRIVVRRPSGGLVRLTDAQWAALQAPDAGTTSEQLIASARAHGLLEDSAHAARPRSVEVSVAAPVRLLRRGAPVFRSAFGKAGAPGRCGHRDGRARRRGDVRTPAGRPARPRLAALPGRAGAGPGLPHPSARIGPCGCLGAALGGQPGRLASDSIPAAPPDSARSARSGCSRSASSGRRSPWPASGRTPSSAGRH